MDIVYHYAEGLKRNESSELSMKLSAGMWLRPLEPELEQQNVSVHVTFLAKGYNHISLREQIRTCFIGLSYE